MGKSAILIGMKQIITAKLKLHTDPAQFAALRRTQLAYREALNVVSRHAFAHGKTSNQRLLQREMYAQIRARLDEHGRLVNTP